MLDPSWLACNSNDSTPSLSIDNSVIITTINYSNITGHNPKIGLEIVVAVAVCLVVNSASSVANALFLLLDGIFP